MILRLFFRASTYSRNENNIISSISNASSFFSNLDFLSLVYILGFLTISGKKESILFNSLSAVATGK